MVRMQHDGFRGNVRNRLACLVISIAFVAAACLMPDPAFSADDWLKIEEEKPLYGDTQQPAAPPAAGDRGGSQADQQKEAKALMRYLGRFRTSLAAMKKIVADSNTILGELASKNKALAGVADKTDKLAEYLLKDAKEEFDKYKQLLASNPHFKFKDPGQDPDFKKRGDEIIENGRKMCQMAQKWARSKKKRERDKLKTDLTKLKDETKLKRDRLKADFQAMVTAIRPVYRGLKAAKKKITPADKRQLVIYYGIIIQGVLDIYEDYTRFRKIRDPFKREVTKAADAAKEVARRLQNNPNLTGVPKAADIRKEISPANSTGPVEQAFNAQKGKIRDYEKYSVTYIELDRSPGIPAVKLALSTNNLVVIYSASKDFFSRFMKKALDLIYDTGQAVDGIEERKRLLDTEWKRSGDSLKKDWECVKKWMSKKPKRYFKGELRQGFGARLMNPKAGAKCAAKTTSCEEVGAQVEAVLDTERKTLKVVAKSLPNLYIKAKKGSGLYCDGVRGSYTYAYTLKYDPSSGAVSFERKNQTIKGRVSGSTLAFEDKRTFTNSSSYCGFTEYLVQTRAKLKEVGSSGNAQALEEAGEALGGLTSIGDQSQDGAGAAP